jgi:type I restriction enzyme, S subunit
VLREGWHPHMNTILKPYPVYKQVDAPWCPRVPEHWQAKRLGSVLKERREVNSHYEEQTVLSVLRDIGVILYSDKGNIGNKKSEDIARYKIVRPDDIVLNSMNVIIGSVGRSRYQGCLSPVYYVLTPRNSEISPEFAECIFQVKPFQQSLVRIGYGILAHRMRIPMEHLKSELLPIPPSDEQAQIVRFIRHINYRVNRLTKAKRRLNELLNEQKKAITHCAVTRGLDPTIPMKPSGVGGLGEVPLHWEVRQLGRFITLQRGVDITKDQQVEGSIPVVSSGGVSSYHNEPTSPGPGVIVGRKGSVGTVYYISGAYWAHDTTLWVREFNGNHERFVYYLLCNLNLKRFDTGSSNPTINRNLVHPEIVAFPPPSEQLVLATFLDHMSNQVDLAVERAQREVSLILEYRARLVSDVVTGQLDVRRLDLSDIEETLSEALESDNDEIDERADELDGGETEQ